jgi:hypothetical protein
MIEPLVALIAGEPGMAERILDAHVDDGSGRCARCVQHDRPGAAHPCVIRSHAQRALAVRENGGGKISDHDRTRHRRA